MYNQTIDKNKCSEVLKGIVKGEEIMNEDYIVAFREILQEAERKQQEALARFHRWSSGTMDPAEEEAYTSAVRECAGKLRRESA